MVPEQLGYISLDSSPAVIESLVKQCSIHLTEILKSKDRAFFFFFLFFFFWLLWVFIVACRLSLVAASRELLSSRSARACHRGGLSCWRAQILGQVGLSSPASRAPDHQLGNCGLWSLVAPQCVESSWTTDQTRVPCIGRRILNCWLTREVQKLCFLSYVFISPNARKLE